MIPMLYTAEDVRFLPPGFDKRLLDAATKHELMLEVIGNPGAYIMGRVTPEELAAFAREVASGVNAAPKAVDGGM